MKKYILASISLALILAGCSDDKLGKDSGIAKDKAISFSVGVNKSRTIYESTDSKQINWESGDEIRIFCAATPEGKADYTVEPLENAKDGTITLSSKDNNSTLTWGEAGTEHTFYAVYPANDNITVDQNGVATFPINRDQKCYVLTTDEKNADADGEKYDYIARPDMSNAYMVAMSNELPGTNTVWLDFKPVMTTVNIVVKGPQNLTSDGTPDVNTEADPILVTGVSVISTITTNSTASKSEFTYQITEDSDGTTQGNITGSANGSGEATEQTETTFISIVNTDGLNAITLNQGETLCLTAFLPPMTTKTAEALQRDIKIRVHTTGGNKTLTLADATVLTESAKGSIKLPSLYTPINGSNWVTPLEGSIYLNQLSIPGTHDAATYDEVGVEINLGLVKPTLSIGKTQELSLQEQWNMGIRAFDLRPAINEDSGELEIYHGIARCNVLFEDVIKMIIAELDSNPQELAIIINRHENDTFLSSSFGKNVDDTDWATAMAELLEKYEGYMIEYDPELTVDDCRGHILFMNRDYYSYTKADGSTYVPLGARIGFGYGWNHDSTGGSGTMVSMKGEKSGTLYVQDFYETINAESTKLSSIYNFLDAAALLDNDGSSLDWYINHTSGYNSGLTILSYTIAALSTTNGYRGNAAYNNPAVYKYLIGTGTNSDGKLRTEQGPTGIVIMDFVGNRTSGSYEVYGDVLPQAIIDNNYKYRMKRKYE